MATDMKTLVCPGPPEHEFEIPKGRGRPPRYCEDHKPEKTGESKGKGDKNMSERPAPGQSKSGANSGKRQAPGGIRKPPRIQPQGQSKLDEPIAEDEQSGKATMDESGAIRKLPAPGKPDTQSRAKADKAADRNSIQQPDTDQSWPRGIRGRPMAKIEFSASELIPTGQYANVAVGPARITAFVDLDHENPDNGIFTKQELEILSRAANELAETVESDVVAVQRNLVLESMQEQLSASNGSS